VCTVVGFPLGATTPATKSFEARKAIREGAKEVDMVINVGALKSGNYELVEEDIRAVTEAAHESGALLKVIIEAALLTDEEKVAACVLAKRARADFVKTSTGFSSGGATLKDVAIMRATVGPGMGVKAAGGIRSYLDAVGMIEAGATRIGASAGVGIVRESRGEAAPASGGKGKY
jgi:deoxyribose-phosphate aldolase